MLLFFSAEKSWCKSRFILTLTCSFFWHNSPVPKRVFTYFSPSLNVLFSSYKARQGKIIMITRSFQKRFHDKQASTGCLTSLLYKKKTLGTEVRRTPDVILRFVNLGHVQLLMCYVVVSLSYSFGHWRFWR